MRRLILATAAALTLSGAPAAHAAGDPLRVQQYGLDLIEADAAHSTTRGEGAVVAVIDTGIDAAHADLAGQLLPGRDFVQNDDTPQDGDGHGTHVAGIVGAAKGNDTGVSSVAPGAKILPVRVLDDDGSGTDANVAKGIDYAVAQKVDVINLSLGGLPLSGLGLGGEFDAAVERAVNAGIVVVAAAGNDSLPVCEQPEVQGKLLCVGAVDKRSMRSFFSSGDAGSIVAPGGSGMGSGNTEDPPVTSSVEDILSTIPGSRYTEIAGTSQATPHVAGVAALLVSRGVRGQDAVKRIRATTKDLGMTGPDPVYGVGLVNARQAVAGLPPAGSAGGGGGGAGPAPTAKITIARSLKISTVRARGLRARCRGAAAGVCRVTIRRGRVRLGSGAVRVKARQTRKLTVKFTARGERMLRRGRSFRADATLAVPGANTQRVALSFRR